MKRLIHVTILLLAAFTAQAQPQYSFTPTSSSPNSIPFNSTVNMKQWVYYPSDFAGMPPGQITKIYIKSNTVASPSFSWLTIKMGSTALNTFSAGPYATGLTTVYDAPFSGATITGNWLVVTLQTPYFYDSLQNFIVECSALGTTGGFSVLQGTGMPSRGLLGYITSSTGTVQNCLGQIGFEQATTTQTPLAVKLQNISIKKENQVNTLSWTVAEEVDIVNYQVERSFDAADFEHVGIVSAVGKSEEELVYSYEDYDREALDAGKVFYRLRIEEESGNFFYSPVVQLRSAETTEPLSVIASPVPFTDKLNFAVSVNTTANLMLTISDAMGRVVVSRQEVVNPGSNTISLQNMEALTAGMYFVQAGIPDYQQTLKILKY
jgi:hypothetical protein